MSYRYSPAILHNSAQLEKSIDNNLVKWNAMVERIKRAKNLSTLGLDYDENWNILIEKEAEVEELKSEINKSIGYLTNCLKKTDDFINVINESRRAMNNKKVGTLEGLLRQTIKKGDIPDNISYAAREVLNQKYDEREKSSVSGGVRKKTKSKKGKRKTIKKR